MQIEACSTTVVNTNWTGVILHIGNECGESGNELYCYNRTDSETIPLQLERFSGNMEISWSFVNVKSIIELLNYPISTDTRLVKVASGHSWVAENAQKMYGCSLEECPGLSLEFHIRKTLHYSANSVWFLRKRCSPLNVNCIVERCNQLNRIPSNKITNMRLQYYIVISFIRF